MLACNHFFVAPGSRSAMEFTFLCPKYLLSHNMQALQEFIKSYRNNKEWQIVKRETPSPFASENSSLDIPSLSHDWKTDIDFLAPNRCSNHCIAYCREEWQRIRSSRHNWTWCYFEHWSQYWRGTKGVLYLNKLHCCIRKVSENFSQNSNLTKHSSCAVIRREKMEKQFRTTRL